MALFKPVVIIAGALLLLIPHKSAPSGYWENDNTYVYYTTEDATFDGESDGVAYFCVQSGDVYGAYVYDTDLIEGDTVTLTFMNRETKAEYLYNAEFGIESVTRIDNAQIVAID